MADFRGAMLTQRGRNLLAKAQTGTTLTFTKIAIGDGLWPSSTDPTQLNNLVSPKLNLPIQEIRVVGDGTVRLRFVLTNTGLSQGFFMREIGIYAQDPDLGEILYAVAYAGDRADFIPADGITKVENVVDIYTVIANAQNVTAVISDTVVLATKQDIDTVKPEASSTAPSFTYPGKLWVDGDEFLKYFNGSNWQGLKVSFADTVDGFHASLTPAPFTLVPLNENGILDLSSTYIKSNVYTFRRVDLTDATSDYELQVGEEAIIHYYNQRIIPLHIATRSGTVYEIIIPDSGQPTYLYPNNTAYPNQFASYRLYAFVESGNWRFNAEGSTSLSRPAFELYAGLKRVLIVNETSYKRLITQYADASNYHHGISVSFWLNPSIRWTSLGTFDLAIPIAGFILIRRLL